MGKAAITEPLPPRVEDWAYGRKRYFYAGMAPIIVCTYRSHYPRTTVRRDYGTFDHLPSRNPQQGLPPATISADNDQCCGCCGDTEQGTIKKPPPKSRRGIPIIRYKPETSYRVDYNTPYFTPHLPDLVIHKRFAYTPQRYATEGIVPCIIPEPYQPLHGAHPTTPIFPAQAVADPPPEIPYECRGNPVSDRPCMEGFGEIC